MYVMSMPYSLFTYLRVHLPSTYDNQFAYLTSLPTYRALQDQVQIISPAGLSPDHEPGRVWAGRLNWVWLG